MEGLPFEIQRQLDSLRNPAPDGGQDAKAGQMYAANWARELDNTFSQPQYPMSAPCRPSMPSNGVPLAGSLPTGNRRENQMKDIQRCLEVPVGFKYTPQNIVMAAGQYREVRPSISPQLMSRGVRFQLKDLLNLTGPAVLPPGLQFDPATGIFWGSPSPPPADVAATGVYHNYQVVLSGAAGIISTDVALKVVNFQPQNFRITHVSQVENNKYMVLVD